MSSLRRVGEVTFMPRERRLPPDYAERVYAGVLGKLIGVYLGRPVENWTYDRIREEFNEINYYVHEQRGRRLIIPDDDISGTFTFLRALPDFGNSIDVTPEQIGQTWLNYLIERTTILWWGGLGNSTEHTAYLRLRAGVKAPESGSAALNTQVVAEQIGAQIFIDGWGMVVPGDPEKAADLARRAASVSHDGEAIYGAQVVAGLVAAAFYEPGIDRLLDTAQSLIPADSTINRLISDLRDWHAGESDWRVNRARLEEHYGYDRYIGNCHIVPNHGLIILSLLHGGGDFHRSLSIVNTAGWDTDCNSGNVGCILGVRGGLAGLENGPDWRGPVADRLFLPSADPGRSITDAVRETVEVVNIGRALAGEDPWLPKGGARFHFSLPGSVQGFRPDEGLESRGVVQLQNDVVDGECTLGLHFNGLALGRVARVSTSTFIPLETKDLVTGYVLVASPTVHSGQTVSARLMASSENETDVACRLYCQRYDANDGLTLVPGEEAVLRAGEKREIRWRVPDTGGYPIAEIGLELRSDHRTNGTIYLDRMTWTGTPETTLEPVLGTMWARAWAKALDRFESVRDGFRHLAQDRGTGLLIHGSRDWQDYRASATIWVQMARSAGIAVRVQGLKRYLALLLTEGGRLRLVREDFGQTILADVPFDWVPYQPYRLSLEVRAGEISGYVDGERLLAATDDRPTGGAFAFVVEEGCMGSEGVTIEPVVDA